MYSGGKATGITQDSRGNIIVEVTTGTLVSGVNESGAFSLVNGVAKNFILYDGQQNVYRGCTAVGTTISGGWQEVHSGGSAVGTTIYDYGSQYVYSGGTETGTTVSSGGLQYVVSGGTATGITQLAGGNVWVGLDPDTLVSGVNESGAFSLVNGVAKNFILYDGQQNVCSGCKAVGTRISGGWQEVHSGGSAVGTTIYSGGSQHVFSGGYISGTRICVGARQYVEGGAHVYGT